MTVKFLVHDNTLTPEDFLADNQNDIEGSLFDTYEDAEANACVRQSELNGYAKVRKNVAWDKDFEISQVNI